MFPRAPKGPTWVEIAGVIVLVLVLVVMVVSAAGWTG